MMKQLGHSSNVYSAIAFLDAYAEKRPQEVLPHDADILKAMESNEILVCSAAGVLTKLAKDEV